MLSELGESLISILFGSCAWLRSSASAILSRLAIFET